MKKTIGIIGGMGPLATIDLYQKIVQNTKANKDQEHIPILIDNNTFISDRSEAILNQGKSPLPELIRSAKRLEKAGAEFLMMSCNTAHYYYEEIVREVQIPLLHMIDITAEYLKNKGIENAGILATNGTIATKIYQNRLEKRNIRGIVPKLEGQDRVHRLIYEGVKAGNYPEDAFGVKEALEDLYANGAEVFIMGCTEIPIAAEHYQWDFEMVDPTLLLAKKAIEVAGGTLIDE